MLETTCDFPKTVTGFVPKDLVDWFGERTLEQPTLEAVCKANVGCRVGLLGPDLLALLCYSYARGILGSQEIELVATRDQTVRRVCGNVCPDRNMIRNFRRRNRDCLLHALQRLFASAHELRFGGAFSESTPPGGRHPNARAVEPTWVLGLTEASKRIEQAIHLDSMMMDEEATGPPRRWRGSWGLLWVCHPIVTKPTFGRHTAILASVRGP